MKLQNDFDRVELHRWFTYCDECWICGKNGFDAFHHIYGRESDSLLNACPIHNFECHLENGQLSLKKVKETLLRKTLRYLLSQGYQFQKNDKIFIAKHYEEYSNMLKEDFNILDKNIGGITLREMSAITFTQWVMKKIDGLSYNNPKVREISALNSTVFSRTLPDEKKLEIVNKLKDLGIDV